MTAPTLHELQKEAYAIATEKGFHPPGDTTTVGDRIALIHSELSEALEEYRDGDITLVRYGPNGKLEGFGVELADAVIRIFDLAELNDIPLQSLIQAKMAYNRTRPHRHGRVNL